MNLLEMSLYGAVMVLAALLIRTVTVNWLPKRTFVILWCAVLVRLLVPIEISSDFSVYSLAGHDMADMIESRMTWGTADAAVRSMETGAGHDDRLRQSSELPYTDGNELPTDVSETGKVVSGAEETVSDGVQGAFVSGLDKGKDAAQMTSLVGTAKDSVWLIIYGTGAVLCMVYFLVAYVRCRFEFGMSLPVSNDYVERWLKERHRTVRVRVSDRIDTPLTYRVIRPVILLPKKTEWENTEQLKYVLWHEYTHICYGDGIWKIAVAAALCLHWFNPLVWVLYILMNRDIELACDESVVHRCGVNDKAAYANMLIAMEVKRSGFVSLCNNFSQNAIEGRVRAIMKMKKISLAAVLFAAGLVVGVTTAFATSAGKGEETGAYTQEEKELLDRLRFDGYESMTVSAFRDRANRVLDESSEYIDLFDRMENDEALYNMCETDDTSHYLFYVLGPLVAQRWQERQFDGAVSVSGLVPPENVTADMAVLEYSITMNILDADAVTVGEYVDVRLAAADMISNMLLDYPAQELADAELMQTEIERLVHTLTKELSTEGLYVDVEWVYQPNSFYPDGGEAEGYYQSTEEWEAALQAEEQALRDEIQRECEADLETVLNPYTPFGLTYEYDAQADDFKMYFEGKEVRGILDEKQGIMIAAHAGISTYAQDAIEVYAVYDGQGKLTGLRTATKEEQEEWNVRRRQSTDGWHDTSEEVREFLPGTSEDYDRILSLKKPDYDKMSLAEFDSLLLDWANEHSDSYDRIECDRIWNDFRVNLSKEDKEFVTCTVRLSGIENAMLVRSLYKGGTEAEAEDASLGATLEKSPEDGAPQLTWCQMYYSFSYHVSDKEKVTVGERDRVVGGMLDGIEDFWEQTDIEALLRMEKSDIIKKLNELAQKYSTGNVTITVAKEGQIGFERMDERSLMEEIP